MKINYLFIIVFLTLSCKEGAKQSSLPTEGSNTEQTNKNTEPAINELKQNGNYSTLFNSSDCKVITAEEISTALDMTIVDENIKGFCSFKSQFPNNKTWHLGITQKDISKSDMQREIQSFKSDETGFLSIQVSESGDTYLCNQHSNGYLSIYNPNYNGFVFITYGSVATSRDFTKEERLEHRDLALKLANTLLEKHQK
jgi:hypothetical protein